MKPKGKATLELSAPSIEACSNSAMRQAARHLGQLFDAMLEPSGLKATQHGLLVRIDQMGTPTMKPLAESLVMDLSALGHTLQPLVRDGFVALTRDASDRRSKRVGLTAKGAAKLDETTKLWLLAQTRFDVAFGPRKAEKLRKALAILASREFGEAFKSSIKLGKNQKHGE